MKINADLGVKLSTQTSTFELLNKTNHNICFCHDSESVFLQRKFLFGDWFRLFFHQRKNADKNTPEAKTNNFRWFPFAEVLYEATEQYKFYAGIDGGVK